MTSIKMNYLIPPEGEDTSEASYVKFENENSKIKYKRNFIKLNLLQFYRIFVVLTLVAILVFLIILLGEIRKPCRNDRASHKQVSRPVIQPCSMKETKTVVIEGDQTFVSCVQLLDAGYNTSGVYTIYPFGIQGIDVYCDQEIDGGGWMIFLRRFDGYVGFYRGWESYRDGFGKIGGEHWLGLDIIHRISNSSAHEMRVDLEDFQNSTAFAKYSSFYLDSEVDKYKLHVSNYTGTAGDSLVMHNLRKFSTFDQDNNDGYSKLRCALHNHGAWWYKNCQTANLNGIYLYQNFNNKDGMEWRTFRNLYSLKGAEMKMRGN